MKLTVDLDRVQLCPICGHPRGGRNKKGRDHTECSKLLKAQHAGESERKASKKLKPYSQSTIDYIAKRYGT